LRKTILYTVITLISISFLSCGQTETDYGTQIRDEEIYEFMNFVMEDLKISDTVNLQVKPVILFRCDTCDRGRKIVDFTLIKFESVKESKTNEVVIKIKSNRQTVLKPSDTLFVLNQNKRLTNGFEWDLKRLNFAENESTREVWFSLPHFSKDKESVIISTGYYDKIGFMSGGSSIWFYEKNETGWKKKRLRMSIN
jgi:hypothetical protein